MGVEIYLKWKDNGKEEYLYVFKLSVYPYELQDYNIPDKSLPERLDSKYLSHYLEWLKKLDFLVKFAPKTYKTYNTTSNNIKTIRNCIKEDIISTQEAINKSKILQLKQIKNWVSVS